MNRSNKSGSRVQLVQVLRGWKPGEVWAVLRDPSTQEKVIPDVLIITLSQDDEVELALELRKCEPL